MFSKKPRLTYDCTDVEMPQTSRKLYGKHYDYGQQQQPHCRFKTQKCTAPQASSSWKNFPNLREYAVVHMCIKALESEKVGKECFHSRRHKLPELAAAWLGLAAVNIS
jgi:hypothetical protein